MVRASVLKLLSRYAFPSEAHVLDLGVEGESLVAHLPERVRTCFVESDVRHVRASRAAARHRPVDSWDARLCCDPAELGTGVFDLVIYGPRQREAKARVFAMLDACFHALKPGGSLLLFGRRNRGILSLHERARAVFQSGEKAAQAGTDRLYVYEKLAEEAGVAPEPSADRIAFEAEPGVSLTAETEAGVFSWDAFDPGSLTLVEAMHKVPGTSILDVGCGWGAIGMSLAALRPASRVTMIDVDERAVRCAARNAAANGLANAEVALSDVYEACAGKRYDLIVSNPPFHEGNAVAHPLVYGAPRHLEEGGHLALVVIRTGPYVKAMEKTFRDVGEIARSGRYTVLLAARPQRA